MLKIRAIFFDFGKTLIGYDLEFIFRFFSKVSGVPPEDIHNIWGCCGASGGLNGKFEKGLILPGEFRKQWKEGLIARVPAGKEYKRETILRLPDDKFDEGWNEMFGPRDLVYEEYLKRLRDAGYYLGVISNINPLHLAFVRERYKKLFSFFDSVTASCDSDVQSRKPDWKIYGVAFGKANVHIEQIVYIDDVEENAKAVERCGAHGIVAKTMSQIFSDLKKLGVRW